MKNKKPAQIFHFDLYGKREDKYDFLNENSLSSINWTELHPQEPELFFVPKDFGVKSEYDEGFSVTELFPLNNVGVVSGKDELYVNNSKEILTESLSIKIANFEINKIKEISFYPFDNKFIYYDTKLIERARERIMFNVIDKENISIIIGKQCVSDWRYIFSSKIMTNLNLTGTAGRFGSGYLFPLYLYPDEKNQDLFATSPNPSKGGELVRIPNLNMEIVNQIADGLGLTFTNEKEHTPNPSQEGSFAPIDILDYIYAVLHSPSYREKYKEFLKINFPRVPFPKDKNTFWKLVKLGGEIRQIHLLESPTVENYITQYPEDGDNVVVKPIYKNGNVYINDTQYFANVPEVAWNFYIGGYQPAQKWLKDRKDRELSYEDILHYQKIIVALTETDRIMREIDEIGIE